MRYSFLDYYLQSLIMTVFFLRNPLKKDCKWYSKYAYLSENNHQKTQLKRYRTDYTKLTRIFCLEGSKIVISANCLVYCNFETAKPTFRRHPLSYLFGIWAIPFENSNLEILIEFSKKTTDGISKGTTKGNTREISKNCHKS